MKKYNILKKAIAILASLLLTTGNVYGEVITAPLDSRPISLDYLEKLAKLNNEDFFAPEKDILDMFPTNVNYLRFAQSDKVREQIREKVALSNTEDTTVIINTSSYMTSGLVGSRVGENYSDFHTALDELEKLVTDYDKPQYYVNLSMPRTLPETRKNNIWRDNEKCLGMGYFYLKNNPDCEDKNYISLKFSAVTPTQLIMEWSYITNKINERGESSLQVWEKDFINYFNRVYKQMEPYKTYLAKYIVPFSSVSETFSRLLQMQESGKIKEITVSNDDFQIPDFITYFNNKNADWIPRENGTPIKFSFARNYITNGPRSIYKLLADKKGVYEADRALQGKSDSINFLFGTDEIPQLIYARNLSRRNNLSVHYNIINTGKTSDVAEFDVLSTNSLIKNDINFVSVGAKKTDKKVDIYMYDYNNTDTDMTEILRQMNESRQRGRDVGLIEIYSSTTASTGSNELFKTLVRNSSSNSTSLGITDLICYSAWNTNANAIGLGIAYANVYQIMKEICPEENEKQLLENHINMLAIHCAEDGYYTARGKRILSEEGFVPVYEDTLKSEKLLPVIGSENITKAFSNKKYVINNNEYVTDNFNIKDYNFPWGRIFECYLDFEVTISKK